MENATSAGAELTPEVGGAEAIFEWRTIAADHNVSLLSGVTGYTEEEGMSSEETMIYEGLRRMAQITNKVIPIVIVLILVLGLFGNALVVYVTVVTNRTAKHPIHSLFVLNLAAADVFFLLASAPYQIAIHSSATWRFGSFLCPFIPFSATCSMFASIYTICALAWMRFMALVMPFRFQSSLFSTRKAGCVVIFAIWVGGTVLSSPNLVHYKLHHKVKDNSVACGWDGDETPFAMVKLVMTYLLPLILMSVFYAIIGREVLCYMMEHSRKGRRTAGGRSSAEDQQECAKSAMVVLSLILAFLICWLPHLLQTVFKAAGVNSGIHHIKSRFILDVVGQCMSYAHASVNPFIYTFASPMLRRNLRTTVRKNIEACSNRNNTCENTCAVRIVRNSPSATPIALCNLRTSSPTRRHLQTNTVLVTESRNGKTDHIHTTTAEMMLSLPTSPDLARPRVSYHGEEQDETCQVLLDTPHKIESAQNGFTGSAIEDDEESDKDDLAINETENG